MKAAESFPVSEFIREEMDTRGWSVQTLLWNMVRREHAELACAMELVFACADDKSILLGEDFAERLAEAFGTDKQYWLNLDKAWRES